MNSGQRHCSKANGDIVPSKLVLSERLERIRYIGVTAGIKNWVRHTRRSLGVFAHTNFNKTLGRSFVADPKWRLFIEPISFCNLECKFCSYPKSIRTRTSMNFDLFKSCVDQAAKMGFQEIFLTPITGDVFMDKQFVERLRYIDDSPIRTSAFYTNFIGADTEIIREIFKLRKLRFMEISLYGHDVESFRNITGRGETQYRRLLCNLHSLKELYASKPKHLEIALSFRTYRSFNMMTTKQNTLIDLVNDLSALGTKLGQSSSVDNWGGVITPQDVKDIQMDLTDGSKVYKKGACALPFDSIQVTATGEVNACACRDPKGSLRIGNLNEQSLNRIISTENAVWMNIIEEHEKGRFNEVCRACGFYQSIYDPRRFGADAKPISKDEYFNRL